MKSCPARSCLLFGGLNHYLERQGAARVGLLWKGSWELRVAAGQAGWWSRCPWALSWSIRARRAEQTWQWEPALAKSPVIPQRVCSGKADLRPGQKGKSGSQGQAQGAARPGRDTPPCTAALLETEGKISQVKEEQKPAEDPQGQTAAPHLSWS